MESDQLYLFKDKRFLPLFIVQLCGCLNDSILKNALIILITYKLSSDIEASAQSLVLLANAIFVIPFIIFASLAGQLADKYERIQIVKIIKVFEIAIVMLSAYGFVYNDLIILFCSIGLMGVHSALFGPIKYSVLPDQLKKNELLAANGFVEAGTFIAILIGTMLGGFYNTNSSFVISLSLVVSVIGFAGSFFMPKSGNYNPNIKINLNIFSETVEMMRYAYSKKQVYLAILGISWFWFIGAAILAQIPSLTKNTFGADENVANLFLATFSIGVGVGSFWCSRIFNNEITTKYVFAAALGISICGIDLFFASRISAISYEPQQLKSIFIFLSKKHNWRILIDLFFLAAIGGLYIVPLFAVMQYFSSSAHRSRVIAANNLISSVFMAGSTIILSIFFSLGYSIPFAILMISLLNMVVAIYIYQLIPEATILPVGLVRKLVKFLLGKMYSIEVRGVENFHKAGDKVVIIANHLSYLDSAILALYLPEKVTFAINTSSAQLWWVKPFLKFNKTFPVAPDNAMAIKTLIYMVRRNKKVAIFPEGRISTTGSLMKIYEGPGMIADRAGAVILPVRIDGTQFTHFSKLKNILKTHIFPQVTLTILPPVKFTPPEGLDSRHRRKYISQALYDVMTDMMFESSNYKITLFNSLIEAAKIHGYDKQIVQDIDNNIASYRNILLKTFILADLLKKETKFGENVGLMLPNAVGTVISFYAMQAIGRVPTMINFTSGASSIISACKTAIVKTLYTSRKFVDKADLSLLVEKLKEANIKIAFLEDLRPKITLATKIKGMIGSFFPRTYYNIICPNQRATIPAVTLFTSGTEGQPKAVVLSHQNIQANKCQIFAKVDFGPYDLAFNALPMFHCFGLTGSIIMLLNGIKTFYYPSPLHYRVIPEVIYDIGATIMFGTDTFLNGYSKYAHPYDFYSLRYVFAGAEKLKAKTRQQWLDKYGVRIFEGYGVTETSPVIAANTSMHDRAGTVGRLMPKIDYYIKNVEGILEGGRLCVKGPNIMLGYIKGDNPGVIEPPMIEDLGLGWYDTGDIVKIDDEGYVTILGRAKRFAKIAGEMVSLYIVEDLAHKIDDEALNAAVCIEDEQKGEQILLYTTSNNIIKETMANTAKKMQVSDLHIPRFVIKLTDLPILTTGKINYLEIVRMAKEYVANMGKKQLNDKENGKD